MNLHEVHVHVHAETYMYAMHVPTAGCFPSWTQTSTNNHWLNTIWFIDNINCETILAQQTGRNMAMSNSESPVDVFQAHFTKEVPQKLPDSNILAGFVPANCTDMV